MFLKFSTTWIRGLSSLLGCFGRPAIIRRQGIQLQENLVTSKFGAAVISSLVEFQEVQIYFVTSIQIATLVSFNPGNPNTGTANSNSYGEATSNSATVAILGINGAASILLTQYCLQRAGMHWWYTFVIMSTTVILALVVYGDQSHLMPPVDALWEQFESGAQISSCGNEPSPMTYCQPNNEYVYSLIRLGSAAGYITFVVGPLAWAVLFLDQLAFTIMAKFPSLTEKLSILSQKLRFLKMRRCKFWSWSLAFYWFGIQTLFFSVAIVHICSLLLLASDAGFNDAANWSFGQFIAAMVWAPTIAKYLYFIVCMCPSAYILYPPVHVRPPLSSAGLVADLAA
jgi:hypothetical protein